MANTKRKPEETPRRSPGKSKFVFPKRESPPVDNAYFDRLFSELQEQKQDSGMVPWVDAVSPPEPPLLSLGDIRSDDPASLSVDQDVVSASLPQITEISGLGTLGSESVQSTVLQEEPRRYSHSVESDKLGIAPRKNKLERPVSSATGLEGKQVVKASPEKAPSVHCNPETSEYVDKLKLKYRLSKGEANVFRYLLGNTQDVNQVECYITIPKLAEAVQLTTRGCQLALKSLQMRGFIIRTEEYDPSNKLGIKIQVRLASL